MTRFKAGLAPLSSPAALRTEVPYHFEMRYFFPVYVRYAQKGTIPLKAFSLRRWWHCALRRMRRFRREWFHRFLPQYPARRNVLKTGGAWRILSIRSLTKGETAI